MKQEQLGCGYIGYEFGAFYPDGQCVNGYMWDLDSGYADDEGEHYLDIGGDIPCPKCNWKVRIKYFAEELEELGYESVNHPLTLRQIKKPFATHWPSNQRRIAMRYWRKGRREAIRDAKREG